MNKSRYFKWAIISLAILAVLLWMAGLLSSNYIERKIIGRSFLGYHVDSADVSVNLFTLSAYATHAVVRSDDSSGTVLRIGKLKVGSVNPFALFSRKLSTRSIGIDGLDILYYPSSVEKTDSTKEDKAKDFELDIGNFTINLQRFLMFGKDSTRTDTVLYTSANFNYSGLVWSSGSGMAPEYKRIVLNVPYSRLAIMDSLYSLHVHNLEVDSRDSGIVISKVRLSTNYSRYEIGEVTGLQRDWLDISLTDLTIFPVDFNKVFSDTALVAGSLDIAKLDVQAFKDRRRVFPDKPDSKLPDAILRSFPIGLGLDSVIIRKGDVKYAERAEGSTSEGFITFNKLQAKIVNVGNRSQFLHAPTTMHASALFMNTSLLDAWFYFPNPAYAQVYKTRGTLHSMPMNKLNSILPQSAGAEIESGQLKSLNFNFVYNNDVSDGTLEFQYENLKLKLIDKGDKSDKNLLTAVVNIFVISKDNIKGDKNFKEGNIHTEREKKKAIFNFWWQSILSGFKSTML